MPIKWKSTLWVSLAQQRFSGICPPLAKVGFFPRPAWHKALLIKLLAFLIANRNPSINFLGLSWDNEGSKRWLSSKNVVTSTG